jgi:hypothetical protein
LEFPVLRSNRESGACVSINTASVKRRRFAGTDANKRTVSKLFLYEGVLP